MKPHKTFFITYDGIDNSVFVSQVLMPLHAQIEKEILTDAHIISFEKDYRHVRYKAQSLQDRYHIPISIMPRLPFLGSSSLWYSAQYLKNVLQTSSYTYDIIARGPLAAWISMAAIDPASCKKCTIQVRGLLSAEYRFANNDTVIHRFRTWQYDCIEQYVYTAHTRQSEQYEITYQAVSSALKDYLHVTYDIPHTSITIAQHDIPTSISFQKRSLWRERMREQLNIPLSAIVYCYSGSAKKWQGIEHALQFFIDQYRKDTNAILLLLSYDIDICNHYITQFNIPQTAYRLCSVPHHEIYHYLATADVGLLFRDSHIINWVSRPTKALEYRAVGLTIVHNNTVHYLITDTHASI